ncbi:MAG: anthranilate phosphoribosyltransferase, partial [Nitrospiria bacterium]
PEDLGFKKCNISDLLGGSAETNGKYLVEILKGGKGPKRDIVLLNSAPVLIACEKAKTFNEAIPIAEASIDSGRAYQKLMELIELSNQG